MKMIVFSGLPGTGKSKLAEALARNLGIPVFTKDLLEASLLRSGLTFTGTESRLGVAGYDLLTTLAERQLMLNQSVILDSVASTEAIRNTWHKLANHFGGDWRVIECTDESFHLSRLRLRERKIPGWHELTWADVQKVKQYYADWDEEHLIVDMFDSFDDNFAKARAYCE